ncbi:hypothetical protein MASAN616_15160 [Streptococcus sp. SN-1]|jgi:hypothetical protein|uniref:Uncharacterized protein n=1 Tax=Streptococcus sp. SN-1 TaxID=3074854 RepID=A0AAT9G2C7_9STRE
MKTSDILATIAIFVSIFTFIINLHFENKRLKRESDAKFFQDIYFKYMKDIIPKVEANISFNSTTNRLEGIKPMIVLLQNLRKKTTPYKFVDTKFYESFTKKIMNVEDFYSDSLSHVTDSIRYEQFHKDSTLKITELYLILNQKFRNKRFKND